MGSATSSNLWGGIGIFLVVVLIGGSAAVGDTISVDDDGPADFNNIQAAISDANEGDTIVVGEGTYFENINFNGKNITVTSTNPDDPNVVASTIIDGNQNGSVVSFAGTENASCLLSGFTIANGKGPPPPGGPGGIHGNGTTATIENNIINGNLATGGDIPGAYSWGGGLSGCDGIIQYNTISNNSAIMGGGIASCHGIIQYNIITNNSAAYMGGGLAFCDGIIQNNTISNNEYDGLAYCIGAIVNCIVRENSNCQIKEAPIVRYCNIQGGWPGEGNIDTDPCFADPNNGDLHLKSQGGRYEPTTQSWVYDDVTSPCIDAGNPLSPIGPEPFPNGGVVNMGAYGGTVEASKSYFGKPPCEIIVAGDINGDCEVNFLDLCIMGLHWCESGGAAPTVKYQVGECTGRSDSKTQLTNEPTRFSVEVRGSYIHFEDVIAGNCCADKLEVQMTLEDGVIILFEDEYVDSPCRCTCSYPTSATLGPFDDGTYRLDVYKREFVGGQVVFTASIGSTTITIGPG